MRSKKQLLSDSSAVQTARGIGWASIGVGLTELLAPKQIESLLGVDEKAQNTGILRVLGVRELMHGFDLLTHRDPAPGLWSRVAGDMLDGALLAAVATKARRPGGVMAACAMVLPLVLLDMLTAPRLSASRR